ncbi:hypothetical protein QBC39DRAFT_35714 [Podospora conica]|nr:hypothetical protein QBC39DRAFT_35714 [Schizothecium conicum]
MSNPQVQEWSPYLDRLPDQTRYQRDVYQDCLDLKLQESRIFSGERKVEVWKLQNGFAMQSILDVDILDDTSDVVYVFHQRNSWAALDASLDDLRSIMTTHRVSPRFFETVHAFGIKGTREDDPYFNLCYLETSANGSNTIREHLYLLRTYEKHGRSNLKDPWSLRQMALYHQHDTQKSRTVWILIQPFQQAKSMFLNAFETQGESTRNENGSIFLTMALQNWRWYLDHKRRLASSFAERTTSSSATPKSNDHYRTAFSDCQKLQKLTDSLSLAQHILRAHRDTCLMLAKGKTAQVDTLRKTAREAEGFARTAAQLERSAKRTSELASKLLEYRHADQFNNQAGLLATLAQQTNAQTRELRQIASESRSDSRYSKILGFVATIYLPASLLASLFSSNLIQLPRTVPEFSTVPILYVSQAIWVFALVSICLTGATLAGTVWCTKRRR